MNSYLITYDLVAPGQAYKPLIELLREKWKAKKIAESVWLAWLRGDAGDIRDAICYYLDKNDRVVVVELPRGADWAYANAFQAGADFLALNVTPAANAA